MNEELRKGWRANPTRFGVEYGHAKGRVFARLDGRHWGIHLAGEKYESMESYPSLAAAMDRVEAS